MKIIHFGFIFIVLILGGCHASKFTTEVVSESNNHFPEDWIGHWKGELVIDQVGKLNAIELQMELIISELDSARWAWTIVYGEGEKANHREYELISKDSSFTHFVIDEKNSILLDQYLLGNRMIARFQVNNNMIFVEYRLEGGFIHSLMYGGPLSDSTVTGKEVDPSEGVEKIISYRMRSIQRAVLKRQ